MKFWGLFKIENLVINSLKRVDKTLSSHSHVSNAFSKGMFPTRLSGSWSWLILVVDDSANFGGFLNQLPDIENLCGHDTGGFRE
jgi:hypothetical protein